jgi:transcriptional regulator with XRE-family HTH domain
MHSTSKPVIRLRQNEWDRRMRAKKLTTPNARAERLGFNRTTVARIERGETRPGYEFIAAVLHAFPEVRFEDVFEVDGAAS